MSDINKALDIFFFFRPVYVNSRDGCPWKSQKINSFWNIHMSPSDTNNHAKSLTFPVLPILMLDFFQASLYLVHKNNASGNKNDVLLLVQKHQSTKKLIWITEDIATVNCSAFLPFLSRCYLWILETFDCKQSVYQTFSND